MRSIDTNALLRLLVDEPGNKKQCETIRNLIATDESLYVAQVVQIELVWVLQKAYRFSKEQIVFTLAMLGNNRAFELQRYNSYMRALAYYREYNIGFSDCIILSESVAETATPLITFDKKLGKLENTLLI